MSNKFRAEKTITVEDKEYTAKMSLDTCARIESTINCSLLKLANRLSQADILIEEVIQFLYISFRASGKDVKTSEIKQLVAKMGYADSIKLVGELLTLALDAGTEDSEDTDEKKNS